MRPILLAMALGPLALPALWACTGPPPLHLEVRIPGSQIGDEGVLLGVGERLGVSVRLAQAQVDSAPFEEVAGAPAGEGPDRVVKLASSLREGDSFTINPMGPIPSMLLQWGGFDPLRPWSSLRRTGFRLELHEVGAPLPAPPGWQGGPWKPEEERWYAEPGMLVEDDELVRFVHLNMAGRFGEDPEPWVKLEPGPDGKPSRLHLWLVLDASFEDPENLFLRLQPGDPRSLGVRWNWGDGQVDEALRGGPDASLGQRLQAAHVYREPSPEEGYQAQVEVRFDWLFGNWAKDGDPWVWNAEVQYLGFVDLAPVVSEMTAQEVLQLVERVDGVRSRLRCLPGERGGKVFERGSPCNYQVSDEPDSFLQSGGAAVPALLRSLLPERLREKAASLPRGGEGASHSLRYVFSGSFPHHSAPTVASDEVQQVWGVPGRLRVRVR